MSTARVLGRLSATFGAALLAAVLIAPSSLATSSSTSSTTTSRSVAATESSEAESESEKPSESDAPDTDDAEPTGDGTSRDTFTDVQDWADVPRETFVPDYAAIQERMDEVTEEFSDRGRVGIALLDRANGTLLTNEFGDSPFTLASTTKIYVAEVVGFTNFNPDDGPMAQGSGDTPDSSVKDNMLRDDAVRLSDNDATTSLWREYGGREIIDSVKERYGLSDATINNGDWGSVSSSPEDLVIFFDGMLNGSGGLPEHESDYLKRLLYSSPKYSYGGTDQDFGLRAGAPGLPSGQKNGWVPPRYLNSAGFLGDDERFAMAVLTERLSADQVTEVVDVVLDGGDAITDPASVDRSTGAALASLSEQDGVEASGSSTGINVLTTTGIAVAVALLAYLLGWAVRGRSSRP